MSEVGLSELIILFLIGLIILGPERLPRIANQLGSWLGQARRMTRVMKRQLEEELDIEGKNSIQPDYPQSRAEHFQQQAPVDPDPAAEEYTPANEHDDTYSPAHEADEPGTGVGDQPDDVTPAESDDAVADASNKESSEPDTEAASSDADADAEPRRKEATS